MNLKKIFAFFLALLLLSLAACSAPQQAEPPLEERSDEDVILSLLSGYRGFPSAPVRYEVAVRMALAGMDINLKSTVSLAGDGMAASCETKVLDTTVAQEMVYVDGTLYVSALGVNVKGPATEAEARKALEAMQVRIPDDNLGAFSQKTLLRSEDGSCRVILSEPTVDLLSLLNFSHLIAQEDGTEDAPAEGEEAVLPEEESLRFTKISDVYLSLAFSAEGTLTGMELGGDVTCLQNGVESLMTLKVTYKILSTDPAQVQVAPPADGDSYADAEDSADPEGGENSEENAG